MSESDGQHAHEKLADKVDTAAKTTVVIAAVAKAGALLAAPAGLSALGVSKWWGSGLAFCPLSSGQLVCFVIAAANIF